MANYFQFFDKVTGESPTMTAMDEILCRHFGEEIHPTQWFRGWYDSIGFALACGRDWDWIKERLQDCPDVLVVAEKLEADYRVEAWCQR